MLTKVILVCLLGVVLSAPQGVRQEENYGPPEPYTMSYEWTDEEGNSHSRTESGDSAGTKTGVYRINYVNGQYRTVEYVSDDAGTRFTVSTNEAGTGPEAPADTIWNHEQPPAGIYEDRGRPRNYKK